MAQILLTLFLFCVSLLPAAYLRYYPFRSIVRPSTRHFLLCGHFNSNTRSMRVQQKVGFVPYRKMTYDTKIGTKEQGILNLLVNPKKTMKFNFSHPETLIYANQ